MDFTGKTVAVIASGPSLAQADCDLVESAGIPAIAVNTSWRMARFAGVIYAGDAVWWDVNIADIDIPAQRWTCSRQAHLKHGVNLHSVVGPYNSGARAVQFALENHAKRLILLGCDCSLENGIHWHGRHEQTNNPTNHKVRQWHAHFGRVSRIAASRGVPIINCSRKTALRCFPIRDLESEIAESDDSDVAVAG